MCGNDKGTAMDNYRLYFFGVDGHISGLRVLTCADDGEAIMRFERHASDRPMELWHLERRVKSYSPAQPGAGWG